MTQSPFRSWLMIAVPVAAVLGAAVAGWLRDTPAPAAQHNASPLLEKGMRIEAAFTGLQDVQGGAIDDSRFTGRYRLVAFGFTSCPDICPTMLAGVHQALEQLGSDAERIVPVFVSVDPERDTAGRVAQYVAAFDKRIVGLTGEPAALANLAQRYHVYYTKRPLGASSGVSAADYTIDHTAMIYLLDPQQRIRALIPTSAGPQTVAEEIVSAWRAIRDGSE